MLMSRECGCGYSVDIDNIRCTKDPETLLAGGESCRMSKFRFHFAQFGSPPANKTYYRISVYNSCYFHNRFYLYNNHVLS